MGGLDADANGLMISGGGGCPLAIHVGVVLLRRRVDHAEADDVDEGVCPGSAAIDNPIAEIIEIAPARAAGVDHRGHTAAKAEAVGENTLVTRPTVGIVGRRVHVGVNVYKAGCNV